MSFTINDAGRAGCGTGRAAALNARHGHTLAGERFMAYQKYGPEGRDGKKGTADDLANPLKGVLGK